MENKFQRQDILLLLILVVLTLNLLCNFSVRRLNAETFRLDDCITTEPGDKPNAYLHVVTH